MANSRCFGYQRNFGSRVRRCIFGFMEILIYLTAMRIIGSIHSPKQPRIVSLIRRICLGRMWIILSWMKEIVQAEIFKFTSVMIITFKKYSWRFFSNFSHWKLIPSFSEKLNLWIKLVNNKRSIKESFGNLSFSLSLWKGRNELFSNYFRFRYDLIRESVFSVESKGKTGKS